MLSGRGEVRWRARRPPSGRGTASAHFRAVNFDMRLRAAECMAEEFAETDARSYQSSAHYQ